MTIRYHNGYGLPEWTFHRRYGDDVRLPPGRSRCVGGHWYENRCFGGTWTPFGWEPRR